MLEGPKNSKNKKCIYPTNKLYAKFCRTKTCTCPLNNAHFLFQCQSITMSSIYTHNMY